MSPGELCVILPSCLEVGLTFSLLILCMIRFTDFKITAFFRKRAGCRAYVSAFHCPYSRYLAEK